MGEWRVGEQQPVGACEGCGRERPIDIYVDTVLDMPRWFCAECEEDERA